MRIHSAGVTLLELLLTMGVLAAIAFFALALLGFQRTTQLDSTADALLELATEARGNSVSGEQFAKWGISAVNPAGGDPSYAVFFSCVNDNCDPSGERREIKSVFLPNSVVFDAPQDEETIDALFRQRSGELEPAGGLSDFILVLYLAKDPSQARTIQFWATGLVEIVRDGVLTPVSFTAAAPPPEDPECGTVTLAWDVVPQQAAEVTGFQVFRWNDQTQQWDLIASPPANERSLKDDTVTPGIGHIFKIRAVKGPVESADSPPTPPVTPSECPVIVVDTWTATDNSGPEAPYARRNHTAIWTGTKMIVWGGITAAGYTNTGGIYDPVTNTWTATDNSGPEAPSARTDHTAIWTGTKMIVWGGTTAAGYTKTGGIYDPVTNTWTETRTTGPAVPSARSLHTAIWTGTKMIVWGGIIATGAEYTNTGGVYTP